MQAILKDQTAVEFYHSVRAEIFEERASGQTLEKFISLLLISLQHDAVRAQSQLMTAGKDEIDQASVC